MVGCRVIAAPLPLPVQKIRQATTVKESDCG